MLRKLSTNLNTVRWNNAKTQNTSKYITLQKLIIINHLNNSPFSSMKYQTGISGNDRISGSHLIPTIKNELNNCAQSLEDLRVPENTEEVGDSDIMYERDGNSGYSCSAGSSLSREYNPEGHILKNLHGEYTRENMILREDTHKNNETQKNKYGGGRFRLPAFAHKSDSNLSQIIGEVESCIAIPSSGSAVTTPSNHQFFLHNSGTNLPDPHLLLPNAANPKGL